MMSLSTTLKKALNCYVAIILLLLSFTGAFSQNPIVTENALTGNPSTEWEISGAGDLSIQGFATDISVNKGNPVNFKIDVTGNATNYSIRIYRMGYYDGNGARLIDDFGNSSFPGVAQPAPLTDPTGLIDCGNWSVSATWNIPSTAVSGIYFAKITRADNNGSSHIFFIVRDDAGTADLLFKTSDATWQAYNIYGGKSLYTGTGGKASKVSYNRPFLTRNGGGGGGPSEDWVFNAEYPMVRWLERNGYHVSYTTDVDMDRDASVITPLKHKILVSVGHDEYWSTAARTKFETARNNGVHLAFFSGNEVYWKTRFENSIDVSNTPHRTLVCYKEGTMGENVCGTKCDPLPGVWTGLWRDGCAPAYASNDGCKPENALTGQISWVDNTSAIQVPFAYKNLRIWRNTSIPSLTTGQTATMSEGTLGYEWDGETPAYANFYPNGRILMSETNAAGRTHKLSLYKHSSGAWVFGSGTVQWSWGLDANHDRGTNNAVDVRMQQATVNLFADMNVQPGTLQGGLSAASASTDVTAPTTTINTPAEGAIVYQGLTVTVNGTATDANTVAGVEISTDGGLIWKPASGTTSWTYSFTPPSTGTVTILSRGFDDSGNMEGAGTPPAANAKTISIQTLPDPNNGPGGPILVISTSTNPFSRYTVEVLRAEGLNAFAAVDISAVTPAMLNNYDVIVLGEMSLTAPQVTMFTDWVNAGGVFIAMKPDAQLSSLLGISPAAGTLLNQYLLVNNTTGTPGAGIVNQTIQFHGTADFYTLNGATALATLYSDATTFTAHPAVTSRNVGTNGGKAIAFTYDLNKSIIYTRQGNPAWAGDSRDGQAGPIRSNNLFFGAKPGDVQPDWVNLNKVQIPQADEQQRLLANIITLANSHKKPLPRFWYLPRDLKAAVVMTGDDHANGATIPRFNQYLSLSGSNNTQAAVDNWNAIRGTSYIYPNTPITNTQAAAFEAQGFEIGLHLNTGCSNYTFNSLLNDFNTQLPQLSLALPGISATSTHRTHCIAWSDWASKPKVELQKGIRLNTDYYYWPGSWVLNRPGMFTGSGMPMRFADLDGTIIDNYQVATQLTDESNQTISLHIATLLDNAIGANGYYGAFCANMHTDVPSSPGSDDIIAAAIARNIPVITAKQMLNWLDKRNNSSFNNMNWNGNQLSFSITQANGAGILRAMLPFKTGANNNIQLQSLLRNGLPVTLLKQTIKGIEYSFFNAESGNYVASYAENTCVPPTAVITSNSPICPGGTINLSLQSATGQAPYSLVVNGVNYSNVNVGAVFATISNVGEISAFGNSGVPANLAANDGQPIEVGVKFRSSVNGYITGIRYYKGNFNAGTRTGKLWSRTGNLLATAVFTNETASGWQEVRFSSPVAITANETYIASYFSSDGSYTFTGAFFTTGVSNGPVTLLASGVDGNNAVYNFPGAGFPTSSFNNANYWVDVLFNEFQPGATSLNYVLTEITDANSCTNTGANLSTAVVELKPKPTGTLTAPSVCAGQTINLVYNQTTGTGPYSLVINGTTYTNVVSGVPFNSNVVAPASTPLSIWNNSTIGGEPSENDNGAVELGLKFRSSVSGFISGVRFYKRIQQPNGSTYTGRLWDANGNLLATVTFQNITNSGWQQANFSSPVPITANTTYVVSYHTPNGQYAFTANAFGSSGITNGPLTALQSEAATGANGNGLFKYGSGGVFPNESFNNANYWVDVVFDGVGVANFNLTNITDNFGCTSAVNTNLSLTVNTLPNQYTVTGGGNYNCGGSGVAVGLSGSQTGVNYQLFRNSGVTAVGSPVAGTGSAISFGNQTIADTYTVVATNTTTSCTNTMTGSATVTISNNTWIGGNNANDWNTAANWSCGIPSGDQTIEISGGTGTPVLNSGFAVTTGSLTISNSKSLIIGPSGSLSKTGGSINFNNNSVTIQSTASGTGSIGTIQGSVIANATNVTVERYLGTVAKRAWRLVTAPLTGTNQYVFDHWQNAGSVNGSGIEIWGPGGTGSGVSGNGLAVGPGNSMRGFVNGAFVDVTNSKTTKLFDNTLSNHLGYFLFVAGPYGSGNINQTSSTSPFAPATVKATGSLRMGNYSYQTSGQTSNANRSYFIGNPYASPVNLNLITGTNLQNTFYMWDPALQGLFNVGGYVAYDRSNNTYNVGANPGTSYSNSPVTAIQSGQAFIARADAAGDITVNFTESMKSSGSTNATSRTSSTPSEQLRVILQRNFAGNDYLTSDGVVAFYYDNANPAINGMDGRKLLNSFDNLMMVRSGINLTFEHRPLVTAADTVFLSLSNTSQANYRFEISGENFRPAIGYKAFLQDAYLNTETLLSISGVTVVNFAVDANASSTGNRFRIVFRADVATSVRDNDASKWIKVYPNPVAAGSPLQIEFKNRNAGKYNFVLYNAAGMQVHNSQLVHAGGSAISKVDVPTTLSKGIYIAEVTDEKGAKQELKITIQ